MHTSVQLLDFARKEFDRNLEGLEDADARQCIEPMNSISWTIAHVAWQHHTYFAAWPAGRKMDARYQLYAYGAPASQPPLDEALALWRDACWESDAWLQSATEEDFQIVPVVSGQGENFGTLLIRCIFHTWFHIGEINAVRQLLGHKPPQFVHMYAWSYPGLATS